VKTAFASPERSTIEEILSSNISISENLDYSMVINSIPYVVLVLNNNRQIVFVNKAMLNYLNLDSSESILGLRPGELATCIHSGDMEGGCGTSKHCAVCGVVRGIITSQSGITAKEECRIITKSKGALDFKLYCVPIDFNRKRYIVLSMNDISDKKRKSVLERIFFHDILNTASGIKGFTELLEGVSPQELTEFSTILGQLATRLIDEIQAQRDLISAENSELILQKHKINTSTEIHAVIQIYENHSVTEDKTICIASDTLEFSFETDEILLRRILSNLVKNALEATEKHGVVTIRGTKVFNYYIFSVHNRKYIEPFIQLEIFKRSFSTKGAGHGIGTYSVKLLTEKYLGGRAGFNTDIKNGTTFYIILPIHPGTNIKNN
jgi:nitrogen-specific signal transduction histidine kinase